MQPAAQKHLVDEIGFLKSALVQQEVELQKRDADIQKRDAIIAGLLEQLRVIRHKLYGPSSEQAPGQGNLFDEAEVLAAEAPEEDTADVAGAVTAGDPAKPRGKRTPLPRELPRIEIVHELTADERRCTCGAEKVEIAPEVSEQLDIVPMKIRVLKHIRQTCVCPQCESAPVTAALPAQILPRSNASAGTAAFVAIAKYVDGLPLYRIEKVLARYGIDIPRHTLARWMMTLGERLVPLMNLLRDHLLSHDVLHMDETPIQVLKEPGRSAQSPSYMWVQSGGPPGQRVVMFDYDPSRSGAVPKALLGDYAGHLMTDGYEGYKAVVAVNGITHLACWAHARRKFVEAQKAQPKGKTGSADVAVKMIGKLYAVERDIADADIGQRQKEREERSTPILTELRAWLDRQFPRVPPKSKLGEALAYLHKYWPGLIRYLARGDLPIDNNPAENAIRPFVVGRKNWLFADTQAGAHASARIYSLVETAKANGHEPYAYLCKVLRELPTAQRVEDIEALLPWNLHPAETVIAAMG